MNQKARKITSYNDTLLGTKFGNYEQLIVNEEDTIREPNEDMDDGENNSTQAIDSYVCINFRKKRKA